MSMCKYNLRARVIYAFTKDDKYLQVKEGLQQEKLDRKYEGYQLE